MILLGAIDYASQYPDLWKFRPSLKLSRDEFTNQLAQAAAQAADLTISSTFNPLSFDRPQPLAPDGNPLFELKTTWFAKSNEEKKKRWRTWLMDQWLIDWRSVQGAAGAKGAAKVREESAGDMSRGTELQRQAVSDAGLKPADLAKGLPWWMWAGAAAVAGFFVWRSSR